MGAILESIRAECGPCYLSLGKAIWHGGWAKGNSEPIENHEQGLPNVLTDPGPLPFALSR